MVNDVTDCCFFHALHRRIVLKKELKLYCEVRKKRKFPTKNITTSIFTQLNYPTRHGWLELFFSTSISIFRSHFYPRYILFFLMLSVSVVDDAFFSSSSLLFVPTIKKISPLKGNCEN